MARRFFNHYYVRLDRDQEFKLSAAEWNELLAGGWIEPEAPGSKRARFRRGVVAWIRGGDLWVAPLAYLPSVTARWFLLWLFCTTVISAGQSAEIRSAQREWALVERERETQNEALLWCTFRNTKGANEFRWIPAGHKAEVLRALRPEITATNG